jgi:hypothetical protein
MASKILVDELAPYAHATDVTLATGKNITGANTQFKITGGSSTEMLTTDGAGALSWTAQPLAGLTYASQWRLDTSLSCTGAAPGTIAAANWEQPASIQFPGVINSAAPMVVNSSTGAWTFPATGVWYITFQGSYRNTVHHTTNPYIYGSNNTGGSWVMLTTARTSQSANWDSSISVNYLFKVADKVTDLVRFSVGTDAGTGQSNFFCNADVNETYATFIKLGDAS